MVAAWGTCVACATVYASPSHHDVALRCVVRSDTGLHDLDTVSAGTLMQLVVYRTNKFLPYFLCMH